MSPLTIQAKLENKATKEFEAELSSLFAQFRQDVKQLTGMFDDTRVTFGYYINGVQKDANPQLAQLLVGLETFAFTAGISRRIERDINSFIQKIEDLSEQVSELQSQIQ